MKSSSRCSLSNSFSTAMVYKTVFFVIAPALVLYALFHKQASSVSENLDDCKYGIIFDAGSTGSRLHVFRLKPNSSGGSFTLVDELFLQIKPGLSSYRDNPDKAAESLRTLMDSAKRYIPVSKWSSTPISLKATAGLRVLPRKVADKLLQGITTLFNSYPFISTQSSVQIMEGDDEGIFSWVTVNLLKGSIGQDKSPSNAVLDLGGGSTQITFVPGVKNAKDEFKSDSDDYFTEFKLFSDNFQLYTHSYLGLGLISSRLSILKGKYPNSTHDLPTVLMSSCLPSSYSDSLSFNGHDYKVSGDIHADSQRFSKCLLDVQRIVSSVPMHHPLSLLSTDSHLCLISYFYDMAVDANIIAPACHGRCIRFVPFRREDLSPPCQDKERGGIIMIKEFKIAAEKVCSEVKERSNPFLCMDLTYISTLLLEGYRFEPKMNVELRKKIGGTEISWALGAMFDMLSKS